MTKNKKKEKYSKKEVEELLKKNPPKPYQEDTIATISDEVIIELGGKTGTGAIDIDLGEETTTGATNIPKTDQLIANLIEPEALKIIIAKIPTLPWDYTNRYLEEQFRPALEKAVKELKILAG